MQRAPDDGDGVWPDVLRGRRTSGGGREVPAADRVRPVRGPPGLCSSLASRTAFHSAWVSLSQSRGPSCRPGDGDQPGPAPGGERGPAAPQPDAGRRGVGRGRQPLRGPRRPLVRRGVESRGLRALPRDLPRAARGDVRRDSNRAPALAGRADRRDRRRRQGAAGPGLPRPRAAPRCPSGSRRPSRPRRSGRPAPWGRTC